MKLFDCRDKNRLITLDAQIVKIEYLAANVNVIDDRAKETITMRFRASRLFIHYKESKDSKENAVLTYAPQIISGDYDFLPLTFDPERLTAMVSQCSQMWITDNSIKIANYLLESPIIRMKYFQNEYYYFDFVEACKKDEINDFVTNAPLATLLEESVKTNDVNVIKAFYELISEGKAYNEVMEIIYED